MAPGKSNRPTPAELEILAVLWRDGPATVRHVHEALGGGRRTGYTTTLKFMQIMLDKGLLTRDERRRAHVYRPATSQRKTQRRLVNDMARRVFGGSTRRLILNALDSADISPEEVKQIRRLLRRKGDDDDDGA